MSKAIKLDLSECIVLQANSFVVIDVEATLEKVRTLVTEHNETNNLNEAEAARENAEVKAHVLDIMGRQDGRFVTTDNLKNWVFTRVCRNVDPELAESPDFATRISKVTQAVIGNLVDAGVLESKRRGGVKLVS